MKKMEKRYIPQKYREVLLHIAMHGAKTKYEIEKETRISHAYVFEAVKYFVDNGILEGEQIGETRVGLPLKKFKLTLYGVCVALKYANPDSCKYGKIIENWRHLSPFLFGKYDYLVKKVGMKEAQMFYFRYMRDFKIPASPEEIFENAVLETLHWYQDFYMNEDISENLEFEKWIKIFQEEPDFRKVIMEYIEFSMDYLFKEIKWFAFLKSKLIEKSKPKPKLNSEEEIRKKTEESVKLRLEAVWDEIPDKEKVELIKSEEEWLKRMQEESLREWQEKYEKEED